MVAICRHGESRKSQSTTVGDMQIYTGTNKESSATSLITTRLLQISERITLFIYILTVCLTSAERGAIVVSEIEISIHYAFRIVDIKAHIATGNTAPRVTDTARNTAVIPGFAVFLHHEIDNTGCSFR